MDTRAHLTRKRPPAKLWRLALVALLLTVSLSACSQVQPAAARAERTYRDLEDRFNSGFPRWIAPVDRAVDDLAAQLRRSFRHMWDGLPR